MLAPTRIGASPPVTANTEDPIGSAYVPELSVDRLTSGELNATTVSVGEDGVIRAAYGASRVELTERGLYGYVEDAPVFRLDEDGLYVKGRVEATEGYFSGDLVGNTITGAKIVGSTIEGLDLSGQTISGATINGGTINGAQITGLNLSGQTIDGAVITGASISGGTLNIGGGKFTVDAAGNLTATSATFTNPTLTNGTITNGTITGSAINVGSGKFTVGTDGKLTATSADITGKITATSGSFTGAVTATSGSFTGSITSNSATITGGTLSVGTKFGVAADGTLTASGATISGAITATSGSFTGSITGSTLSIGSGTSASNLKIDSSGIWAGGTSFATALFKVDPAGGLSATSVNITGTIANSTITGGTMVGTSINVNNGAFLVDTQGNLTATKGSLNIGAGKFAVATDGTLSATGATISGAITATSGTFTGTVSGSTISGGSINIGSGKFTVDTAGALSATGATVTGTIRTAVSGARIQLQDTAGAGHLYIWPDNSTDAPGELSVSTDDSIFQRQVTLYGGQYKGVNGPAIGLLGGLGQGGSIFLNTNSVLMQNNTTFVWSDVQAGTLQLASTKVADRTARTNGAVLIGAIGGPGSGQVLSLDKGQIMAMTNAGVIETNPYNLSPLVINASTLTLGATTTSVPAGKTLTVDGTLNPNGAFTPVNISASGTLTVTGAATINGKFTTNQVVRLNNGGDVSLTSTGHALQIGLENDKTDGAVNTIWDGNEMAARVWDSTLNSGAGGYAAGSFGMTVSILNVTGEVRSGVQGTGASAVARKDYVDARVNLPDSGWKNATYQNGWSTFSTSYAPARYRMLSNGQVEVQGVVTGGTIGSVPVFTLPAGYRPGKSLVFMTVGNDNIAHVDVASNGQVQIKVGSTAAYTSLCFTFTQEL